MTRRPAYRYRCDHCGKTGSSGGHMKRHEFKCTANPNRECGMCLSPKPVADLIQTRRTEGFEAVKTATRGCPACILAAIRQDDTIADNDICLDWNYQEARKEWWLNQERRPASDIESIRAGLEAEIAAASGRRE